MVRSMAIWEQQPPVAVPTSHHMASRLLCVQAAWVPLPGQGWEAAAPGAVWAGLQEPGCMAAAPPPLLEAIWRTHRCTAVRVLRPLVRQQHTAQATARGRLPPWRLPLVALAALLPHNRA